MADENCIQLEMNFNGSEGNRMKEHLDEGIFQVFVELNTPSADTKLEDAAARFQEMEYMTLARRDLACALAFTDAGRRKTPSMDLVRFAASLCKSSRDVHLLYLSGRDKTLEDLFAVLSHASSEGFKNICAVSGATVPGEGATETSRRLFTESVGILKFIRERFPGKFCIGAVVNPFKYTPADDFVQYFKLVKKINFGASFAVTQYGWDMLKLQEMRWNLARRALYIPSIARLLMLTPEKAEEICSGHYPGVHISPDFQIALRRETMHSLAQFEAAQLRRLQIHAAGAKFMGFSGIQISGVETPSLLSTVLNRIAEALNEFHSFEEWRDVYREYYARMDMAPYPNRFYMFDNLFASANPEESPRLHEARLAPCSSSEKFKYRLARALFAHASELPSSEKRLTKKLLFSCRSCQHCRLPQTQYLCPELCPKGMANGPCGCSKANGDCEFSEEECIFAKRMRLAGEFHDYASLEEICVEPLSERPQ